MQISLPKKTSQEWGFSEGSYNKLFPYLDLIKKRINFLDYDCFIVVTGKERRGKSTFAVKLGWYLSKKKLTLAHICMDMTEFTGALQNCKKGEVIIFDEAGTNLFSREAMTTMNRMLTKAFMVSGIKNIAIILCIPSYWSLDSYIRNHRIDLLFHIPLRGKFKAYSTRRAKQLSIIGAKWKSMSKVKPNVYGNFNKSWPDQELHTEYLKKEAKFKHGFIKDLRRGIEGYYSTTKFCEVTGYTIVTVYNWIKEKKIVAKRVGKRWFIPKTEAERIAQQR